MRAVLVDPVARTLTEIDHTGELEDMYKAIGCGTVQPIRLGRQDTLWIDDNGFLSAGKPAWAMHGFHSPLCGRGLILGVTPDGDNTDAQVGLEMLGKMVCWSDLESTGQFGPSSNAVGKFEVGGINFDFIHIAGRPLFRPRQKVRA